MRKASFPEGHWNKSLRAVLFDFDYTLADSSAGVFECINHALEQMGEPPCDYLACCETIGLTLNLTYNRLTGNVDPDRETEFFRLFIERADKVMVDRTHLYSGVHEMVGRLNQRNIPLAIVSTKFRMRIEGILRRDHLLEAFPVIIGGEDVTRHKPDSQGIELALARLGVSDRKAVYVGDSLVDARAARHGNIPFIAVLSGRTAASDFIAFEPLAVIDSVVDLPNVLDGARR